MAELGGWNANFLSVVNNSSPHLAVRVACRVGFIRFICNLFLLPTEEEIMASARDCMPGLHDCPIDGCQHQVPPNKLMCKRHWAMVPGNLGSAVYSAWNWGAGAGTERHTAACQAAIDSVHQQLAQRVV